MEKVCPFVVREIALFNPEGHWVYSWPGIKTGEQVRVDRVGRCYTYPGLKPGEMVWELDFTLLSDGTKYEHYCSQYLGPDGVEF